MRAYGCRRKSYRVDAEEKKLENLALIESLGLPIESDKSMLSVKAANRRIDFWPGSDVWYSHRSQMYGTDIKRLVQRLKAEISRPSPKTSYIEASLGKDL